MQEFPNGGTRRKSTGRTHWIQPGMPFNRLEGENTAGSTHTTGAGNRLIPLSCISAC